MVEVLILTMTRTMMMMMMMMISCSVIMSSTKPSDRAKPLLCAYLPHILEVTHESAVVTTVAMAGQVIMMLTFMVLTCWSLW